jgi:hypothetical protein
MFLIDWMFISSRLVSQGYQIKEDEMGGHVAGVCEMRNA